LLLAAAVVEAKWVADKGIPCGFSLPPGAGVLNHPALALVKPHQTAEHRQPAASAEVQPSGRSVLLFMWNFAPLAACQFVRLLVR